MALVWLINGLFCKLLGAVPRHEQIVARILGPADAHWITQLIGVLEILMALWILSQRKPKLCGLLQIAAVAVMNNIELVLASDLLLFGAWNAALATLFIFLVYLYYFRNWPSARTTR
ncbi:MAG: DoxX-like family protein [Chitinophagaceae bacterium]